MTFLIGIVRTSFRVQWSLAGVLVLATLLVSCQDKDGNQPKIGFILSTMQEERYQRDRKVFEETVEKLGGKVLFASCNNNEQTQAAQVDNLLSSGVDVLVIQPVNGDTASSFAAQAEADGVPLVNYDRLIKNATIAAYITEDSLTVGRLQAEAAVKKLSGKGNVVLLMGQAGHSVAEARTRGVMEVLDRHPGMKVVVKQYHQGWSPHLAMKTMENSLTRLSNKVDAVIANNSGMAHGAIQALEEQDLAGKVFVAGADADLANIKNIVAGKQDLEVLISISDMAGAAAKTAMALAQKKEFKFDRKTSNGRMDVPTIGTPVHAIDRSNLEEKIVNSGFHTREAVFGKVTTNPSSR